MRNISFYTLGCKVNQYETNAMMQKFQEAGYNIVDLNDNISDVCVINTCTVTNMSDRKSRQMLRKIKEKNHNAIIIATGCYAQVAKKQLEEMPEVDIVIGNDEKNDIVHFLEEYIKNQQKIVEVKDINEQKEFVDMGQITYTEKTRAVIKVQDGCNQFCTYCAIPYARGPQRSLKFEHAVSIAQELAKKGHREIVLTGIHTGRYFDQGKTLSDLLKVLLEKVDEEVYFRISSIEITEVDDALIDLMKHHKRLCHHLHIPVQSGCNETLKRMNRPYTIEEFIARLEHIRKEIPDISISTDVICGFVQESDEEFQTTLKNMEKCRFSFMHVFPYSKRNGTKASTMKGEVHGSIAKERVSQLLKLSSCLRYNDMQRFSTLDVLIEKQDLIGIYHGYSSQYHPVQIISDKPLFGRMQCRWDRIENNVYIVNQKEGFSCD